MPTHQEQPLTASEEIVSAVQQTSRIICPECAHLRKPHNQKARTLNITVSPSETLYFCHHCDWSGKIERQPFYAKHMAPPTPFVPPQIKAKVQQIPTELNDSANKIIEFFGNRGIQITDLEKLPHLITGNKFFVRTNKTAEAVGFVYGNHEKPDAIKWRALDSKDFTQDGAAREFYGLELIDSTKTIDELVIVEGEPDVCALKSIGIDSISVPNGAPMAVSQRKLTASEDTKFAYIWEARLLIEKAKKVIIATDGDDAGEALCEEITRRIGRAKCWQVKYPEGMRDPDPTGVIREFGKDKMRELIDSAEPMPLHGVYGASDYTPDVMEIYKKGTGAGASTGLKDVDDLFTIAPGLYVVTGMPNSGKSEFIDQIMMNLATTSSWKTAIASFENPPHMHIAKLAEKYVGKPFFAGATQRMGEEELQGANAFINDHFVFLDSKDGAQATVESIIDRAKQAVMRLGVRALIIDPYNYIEQTKDNEAASISDMLTKITVFAKAHDIAVFFVAHPTKMRVLEDGSYPVPTGNHISGSAAWFSKADVGFTVHRGLQGVEIHSWKVRIKWIGKQGMCNVAYDIPTGRYSDNVGGGYNPPIETAVRRPARPLSATIRGNGYICGGEGSFDETFDK